MNLLTTDFEVLHQLDELPGNGGGIACHPSRTFLHVVRGGPAGGGFSTVEDLFRFAEAMRSDKLVKPETRKRMWSAKPNSPDYGYGFGLSGTPDDRIVGHSGGFPGINSDLKIHRDTGWTVAAMSNYDRGASIIMGKIDELMRRLD